MRRIAEGALRRHRLVTIAALALLAALAWTWILVGAGMNMPARHGLDLFPYRHAGMAMATPWTWPRIAINLAMWWVMMVAMMIPAAAPVVLLYARSAPQPNHSAAFVAGYLACWLGFSITAVLAQIGLERGTWLTAMGMTVSNRWLAGGLLIAAGLYQFSPWKGACLSHCRNPAQWLSRHYRAGAAGGLAMGVGHGAYCVGCCWLLMALLFVGGVMNLLWIAALTLVVAAEKLLPHGQWVARLAGLLFLGWGAATLLAV